VPKSSRILQIPIPNTSFNNADSGKDIITDTVVVTVCHEVKPCF